MTKRKIYRDAITEEEADILLLGEWAPEETFGTGHAYLINIHEGSAILTKLLEIIRADFDFEVKGVKGVKSSGESYVRLETNKNGHRWHNDRGGYSMDDANLHMPWCQLGVSILLSSEDNFTGGDTYYADDDKETNKVKADRRRYDMCVHASDVWHMVESHEGTRTVLLMFI